MLGAYTGVLYSMVWDTLIMLTRVCGVTSKVLNMLQGYISFVWCLNIKKLDALNIQLRTVSLKSFSFTLVS